MGQPRRAGAEINDLARIWRHPFGFTEDNYVHIPWDTVPAAEKVVLDVILSGELGMRSVFSSLYARFAKKTRLVLMASMSEHTDAAAAVPASPCESRCCGSVSALSSTATAAYGTCSPWDSTVRGSPGVPTRPSRIVLSRAPPPVPEKAHRLLYLGQFVERKGLIPFLNVLRDWAEKHPDRKVEFDLIGKGPQQPQIERFEMPPNVQHAPFRRFLTTSFPTPTSTAASLSFRHWRTNGGWS